MVQEHDDSRERVEEGAITPDETRMALLNILEDFSDERLQLKDTQKALLNILEDLHQSREDLQKAHDILEVRVMERTAELQRRTDELGRSNAELEQFAYIASHDLQEPLRMVSSYVQLLERRYKGQLDPDADEFIGFATEGASRMQRLINDLLAYSRVGTRGKTFEPVQLEAVLAQALENLQLAMKEKNAVVTHDPLPVVYGDSGQLLQVFQNLIDNAIKFCNRAQPAVHISAKSDVGAINSGAINVGAIIGGAIIGGAINSGATICSVQDNGIGIAAEHVGKLFLLFQRLHTRREYPGTGLGLAICKRIVERHGGKIWVESQPNVGSTFYFSIPATYRSGDHG